MKLYGKNPVLERLKSNPKSIRKILIAQDHPELSYIRLKAKKWNIPLFAIPKDRMYKLGQNLHAQGLLVEVEDFSYLPYDELLDQAFDKNQSLIFLDQLNDPQNLGGIIRSLACLGGFGIVLPKHSSVEVTEAVLRVACGGDNYVSISKVSNLGNAIASAKQKGFSIAGTVVKDGQSLMDTAFNFPLALVVGSEQKGIRDIVKKHLNVEVTIPMMHARLSFNVAHAATILAYEITRQKKQNEKQK